MFDWSAIFLPFDDEAAACLNESRPYNDGLVELEELLKAFLGGELDRVAKVGSRRVDRSGEPVGLLVTVGLVHPGHSVDADVEALDTEPAADLLVDATLANRLVFDEQ